MLIGTNTVKQWKIYSTLGGVMAQYITKLCSQEKSLTLQKVVSYTKIGVYVELKCECNNCKIEHIHIIHIKEVWELQKKGILTEI